MPFAALRSVPDLLPRDGKLVLPRPMPFRLWLPPRIAGFGLQVRPMPHAKLSAFSDHGLTAIAAFAREARLRLHPIIPLDVSKLHRAFPQADCRLLKNCSEFVGNPPRDRLLGRTLLA